MDKNIVYKDKIVFHSSIRRFPTFEEERARLLPKRQRINEVNLKEVLHHCRLCLKIETPRVNFINIDIPEVATPLQKMYGITVGTKGLWKAYSKICQTCKCYLDQSYEFYCKVIATETSLKNLIERGETQSRPIIVSSANRSGSSQQPKRNETVPTSANDNDIILEDHTQYLFVADTDNSVDLTGDNEQSNVESDLDFDFTDDEKDEDEPKEVKTPKNNETESPEHKKMVNLLLDSGGIESEIDCCMIDKKISKSEGPPTLQEQVMLVLKDNDGPKVVEQALVEEDIAAKNITNPRPIPMIRNSMHDSEYIVCERCKTIYHRPVGSGINKCLLCVNKGEEDEQKPSDDIC